MRDHEHDDNGEVSRCLQCERDVFTELTELVRRLSDLASHNADAQRLVDVAARARRIHALNCVIPLQPVAP